MPRIFKANTRVDLRLPLAALFAAFIFAASPGPVSAQPTTLIPAGLTSAKTSLFNSKPLLLPDLKDKYKALCGTSVGVQSIAVANLAKHTDGRKDLIFSLWCGQDPVGKVTTEPTKNSLVVFVQLSDGSFVDDTKRVLGADFVDVGGGVAASPSVYDFNGDGYDDVVWAVTGEDGRSLPQGYSGNNRQNFYMMSRGDGTYSKNNQGWPSYNTSTRLVDNQFGGKDIAFTQIGYGGRDEAYRYLNGSWGVAADYGGLGTNAAYFFPRQSNSSGSEFALSGLPFGKDIGLGLYSKKSGQWEKSDQWVYPDTKTVPILAWNGDYGTTQIMSQNGKDYFGPSLVDSCGLKLKPSSEYFAIFPSSALEIKGGYNGSIIEEKQENFISAHLLYAFSHTGSKIVEHKLNVKSSIINPAYFFSVTCADVSGDGFDDIEINTWRTNASAAPIILINDQNDGFDVVKPSAFPTASSNFRDTTMIYRDIDGDGFSDLIYWPLATVRSTDIPVQYQIFKGRRNVIKSDFQSVTDPVSTQFNDQLKYLTGGVQTPTGYSINGTVSGLPSSGSVSLKNRGNDPLTVSTNGSFSFPTKVSSGGSYAVTVAAQPTNYKCFVINGSGTVITNVTDLAIECNSTVPNISVNTDMSLNTYPNTYIEPAKVVNTDVCNISGNIVSYPSSWNGPQSLPAVKGAPLSSALLTIVNLKDIMPGDSFSLPPNCKLADTATEFKKTAARIKSMRVDIIQMTQWHWAYINADGSYGITGDTYGALSDAQLEMYVKIAHDAGLKVKLSNQIQGFVDKNDNFKIIESPQSNEITWQLWIDVFKKHMISKAPYFQSLGIDYWEMGCGVCVYWDGNPSDPKLVNIFSEGYKSILDNVSKTYFGKKWVSAQGWMQFEPDYINKMDYFTVGIFSNEKYSSKDEASITVDRLKLDYISSGTLANLDYVIKFGKPIIFEGAGGIQSRRNALSFPGYMEETGCTSSLNAIEISATKCIQLESATDFALQAIVLEAQLELFASVKLPAGSAVTVGEYWQTDFMSADGPTFPNIGYSIRNKPAEGLLKQWLAR